MTQAVCPPPGAPLHVRLYVGWKNAYYRITAVYVAALVTVNTAILISDKCL